jgi:hypothetical protein
MARYSIQHSSPSMLPFYKFCGERAFFIKRTILYMVMHTLRHTQKKMHLYSNFRAYMACLAPRHKLVAWWLWWRDIQGVACYGVEPNTQTLIGSDLIISLINSSSHRNCSFTKFHYQ